jgi:predicted ATPase
LDVHRAARIAATAHGGQIVLSEATRSLVERGLPEGVTLLDLGEHRLKDLTHPERIYQAVVEGLPSEFPSLKSLDARPHNLPVQLTSFIGREDILEEVRRLLAGTRLLTLTGPGGTGKTRLSLQLAAEVLTDFADGAWFVELAPITDPALVPSVVAETLGVRQEPDRAVMETLKNHLREMELFLVLDNFEQVTEAASDVQELLSAAPRLKVAITSRVVLHLYGEQEYPVPPLRLPDPKDLRDVAALSQFEAVALFIDRAVAVRPDFSVTNENAPAVAEICARLDGLPLAIELAASRVKLLSPQEMLPRLEHSLTLLTSRARDLPERQRTLRGAIEWSYELLDEPDRKLFARLAVFAGLCTVEAAEAVCSPGGDVDVLEGLASLVDESLLRRVETPAGETCFVMLETIREYAHERLAEAGEAEATTRRHAEYVLGFAERAEPEFVGREQAIWLDRFEEGHDNVRAALRWAIGAGEADIGLRTGAALWRFWHQRGFLREGSDWLEELLAMPGAEARTAARAKALGAAASLAYWRNDYAQVKPRYEESLEIFRELGDTRGTAEALLNMGYAFMLEEDFEGAEESFEESIARAREAGATEAVANALGALGYTYFIRGDYERALPPMEEAVSIAREVGNLFALADGLGGMAVTHLRMGKVERARPLFRESLELFRDADNLTGITMALDSMATMDVMAGRTERGLRFAGAADAIKEAIGGEAPPELIGLEDPVEKARETMDEEAIQALLAEGRAMGMDKAIAAVLEALDAESPA